jgi:hypothetical protein
MNSIHCVTMFNIDVSDIEEKKTNLCDQRGCSDWCFKIILKSYFYWSIIYIFLMVQFEVCWVVFSSLKNNKVNYNINQT